jgi:hypothetical protein
MAKRSWDNAPFDWNISFHPRVGPRTEAQDDQADDDPKDRHNYC